MPNPYRSNLADMLRYQGANRASGIAQQGQIWGQGIHELGSIAGDTIRGMLQSREDEKTNAVKKLQQEEALRQMRGAQAERTLQQRLTPQGGGTMDPDSYQRELTTMGYPELAEKHKEKVRTEKERTRTDLLTGIKQFDTVAGQLTETLRRVQENPALWPEAHPLVVETVSKVSPQVAAEIPATYDAEKVKGLLTMATDAQTAMTQKATALKAIQDFNTASQAHLTSAQLEDKWLERYVDLVDDATGPEDFAALQKIGRDWDVPESVIQRVGDWSPDFKTRVAGLLKTPAAKAATVEKAQDEATLSSAHPAEWNVFLENKRRKEAELGYSLTIEEAQQLGLYDEAVQSVNASKRTTTAPDDTKDPYYQRDRKDYEDALERYHAAAALPADAAAPAVQDPGDFDTWRYRYKGRGAPSRNSTEAKAAAKRWILAEAARRQTTGEKPIKTDDAAIELWLSDARNRRRIGIP